MNLEITKLRKKIYKNLKEKALSFESKNDEVQAYLENQIKLSKRKFKLAQMDQLSKQVLRSHIIYLGDFHTFDQNVRNVLRVVKMIMSENTECILGLEMVHYEHQLCIDAYLERHLTELEFLESIQYNTSWRFPWSHYSLIFKLAKKHKLKVVALNTQGTLHERDQFASHLLAKLHKDNPQAKLLVLYGELHITKDKIPALMEEKCPALESTIIHQNLDEVYWKLTKVELEQGIVAFSQQEYCIVSAPPWVKYESMIYWYENLSDDPDFDIHEYIIENGAKIFTGDTRENFLIICSELIDHLDLNITTQDLEDFNLYDHTHLEYVKDQLFESITPSIFNFYKYLISTNKSFRFPNRNTFYCSSYSMNRISYLAGIHIFHYYLRQNNLETIDYLKTKSLTKKFTLLCFESIFAYFFSKVINPHRKCPMYKDLKKTEERNIPNLLSKNILDSQNLSSSLKGVKLSLLYESSLIVGHILGEYLYLKMNSEIKKGSLSLKNDFLKAPISKTGFHRVKFLLLQAQDYKESKKRYF